MGVVWGDERVALAGGRVRKGSLRKGRMLEHWYEWLGLHGWCQSLEASSAFWRRLSQSSCIALAKAHRKWLMAGRRGWGIPSCWLNHDLPRGASARLASDSILSQEMGPQSALLLPPQALCDIPEGRWSVAPQGT